MKEKRKNKFTINEMRRKTKSNEKMTWITSYSYPMAYAAEKAGIDMILVGDSGGMTELGYDNTSPVSMNEMITFCKAVRRGAPNTFIIGDMPQGSYEVSNDKAIENALRFIKEGGCDAIKLEGGKRVADRIAAIKSAGILVCGHLGLTPQTTSAFGGYNIQGKTIQSLEFLYNDIVSIQNLIDFLLIEATPSVAIDYFKARGVSNNLPIFGIGAGPNTNGQLLIIHDILGFYPNFKPRFAKNYYSEESVVKQSSMLLTVENCISKFISEVKNQKFPTENYCYQIPKEAEENIKSAIWKFEKQDEIANYR